MAPPIAASASSYASRMLQPPMMSWNWLKRTSFHAPVSFSDAAGTENSADATVSHRSAASSRASAVRFAFLCADIVE